MGSLPPRGAWIEIVAFGGVEAEKPRRSPHGERGLKFSGTDDIKVTVWVAPPTGSVD